MKWAAARGNNNTWCQDSPELDDLAAGRLRRRSSALRATAAELRQRLPDLFSPETPISETRPRRGSEPDQLWRQWHGVELNKPDWASWSHCIATSLQRGDRGAVLWVGFNSYFKAMHFDLPPRPLLGTA